MSASWFRRWILDWCFREEDECNRSGFWIRFLNVAVWDMSCPEIGLDVDAGVDGSRVRISLPYLSIAIKLWPCLDRNHCTWRTQNFPYGWSIIKHRDGFQLYSKGDVLVGLFATKPEAIRFAKLHADDPRFKA